VADNRSLRGVKQCFQRGREQGGPVILVQPPVVSKVYPRDQHGREFLGQ
jgi:hypothetical protein